MSPGGLSCLCKRQVVRERAFFNPRGRRVSRCDTPPTCLCHQLLRPPLLPPAPLLLCFVPFHLSYRYTSCESFSQFDSLPRTHRLFICPPLLRHSEVRDCSSTKIAGARLTQCSATKTRRVSPPLPRTRRHRRCIVVPFCVLCFAAHSLSTHSVRVCNFATNALHSPRVTSRKMASFNAMHRGREVELVKLNVKAVASPSVHDGGAASQCIARTRRRRACSRPRYLFRFADSRLCCFASTLHTPTRRHRRRTKYGDTAGAAKAARGMERASARAPCLSH